MKNKMETNELTAHHRGVILRGICFGAALRGKSPEISEENTVIICQGELSIWDICSISADAEAFGLEGISVMRAGPRLLSNPKRRSHENLLLSGRIA